jgi:hypothetical protein
MRTEFHVRTETALTDAGVGEFRDGMADIALFVITRGIAGGVTGVGGLSEKRFAASVVRETEGGV